MKKSSRNRVPSGGKARSKSRKHPELQVRALADRLHSISIHLLRRVRKEDVSSGEGPARLSALSVLVFAGPKTLGELAAAEQVKPPTMSRIVAGLVRSRLVDIRSDPEDARRMRIQATPKGTHLLEAAREKRIASLASQLRMLPSKDLAKLQDSEQILGRLLSDWR